MFSYLNGTVADLEPNLVVIDVGGVGFSCNASLNTVAKMKVGVPAKIYTYLNVREDALELFGFYDKDELESFKLLTSISGVGPKVADCILLFSLKRVDVFPIDVWVRRVMNDLYIHNEDEEKVNKKELQRLAEEKFLGLSGIAQQYLFYWKRESGKNT